MAKNTTNTLIIGTAIATSIAGSVAAFFWRRNIPKTFTGRTKEMAFQLVNNAKKLRNKTNKNFMIGTLAGSVLAALTAILVAPKSGKKLVTDLTKSLNLNGFQKNKKSSPSRKKRGDQAIIRHAAAAKQQVRKKVNKGIKTAKSKINKTMPH